MGETFIAALLNNLMVLMPFIIVRSYEMGVRWTLGRDPQACKPGFHWKMWLYHQAEISEVQDEFIELPIQSVITQDKKLVCFSVNVGYRICDIVLHWDNVQDFTASIHGAAMTHLAERVRKSTLEELESDEGLGKLENSLKGTLTTRFKRWGAEVYSVGFTNFAEVSRQYRFFGDSGRVGPKMVDH
jgi:regulator of protease activity HflC (stomatin/prohibitin superfamily)